MIDKLFYSATIIATKNIRLLPTTKVNMCNDGLLIDETAMKLMREEK